MGGGELRRSPRSGWRWSRRTAGTCSGAQRAGLTGAWFPRSERTYPAVYGEPHVTAPDLAGVVDGPARAPGRMTEVREIDTPLGPARAHVTEADGAARARWCSGTAPGGGVESADLVAVTAEAAGAGWRVVRVEQPWRVAGKRIAAAPPRLDEGWRAVLDDLRADGPADRSAGARRPERRCPGRLPDGGRAGRRRGAGPGVPAAPAGQAGEEPRPRADRRRRCRWSWCRARPTPSAPRPTVAAVLSGPRERVGLRRARRPRAQAQRGRRGDGRAVVAHRPRCPT